MNTRICLFVVCTRLVPHCGTNQGCDINRGNTVSVFSNYSLKYKFTKRANTASKTLGGQLSFDYCQCPAAGLYTIVLQFMSQMVYKCSYGTMPAVTQPGEIATLCQVVPVVKEVAVHSNTYMPTNNHYQC